MAGSARGLFRATGNKRKARMIALPGFGSGEPITDDGIVEREKDDFYPTPPEPTWAFLGAEHRHLSRFPLIWEPAVGDGAMAREMRAAGHQVIGTDLVARGGASEGGVDFLAIAEPLAAAIVTNPPFSLASSRAKYAWITHGWETLGLDYMALLLPWSWAGPEGLTPVWRRMAPSVIYLMTWKVDFTGEGAPPSYHCWVVWDRARLPIDGHPLLARLPKPVSPHWSGLFAEGAE